MQKTLLLIGILFSLFLIPTHIFAQCDDFESGTFGPPWNPGMGGYTQTIVNTNPAQGTYNLRNSGVSNFYEGPNQVFAPIQPTEVSWWIKTDNTSGANGYFILGDANIASDNGILFSYCNQTSGLRFFNSSGYNHPISANTWYHVEVKEIDWTARNMDIYVDGILILNNWAFRSNTATHVDRVHLLNLNFANPEYDDIRIGVCNVDPDDDGDGYTVGEGDCDDNNPNLNPGTAPGYTNHVNHNPNSTTVYWSNISGSTNYMIRYKPTSGSTWTEATSLRAWRRLYSLLACTDYEVQFKNYKNGAWNCWSDSHIFQTSCAKFINPGGSKESDNLEIGMEVFPNPASDKLNIILDENLLEKPATLILRDQLGREIWSEKIQNPDTHLIQLNVREKGIAAGVYTLSLQSDFGVMTQQVVVSQ